MVYHEHMMRTNVNDVIVKIHAVIICVQKIRNVLLIYALINNLDQRLLQYVEKVSLSHVDIGQRTKIENFSLKFQCNLINFSK